MRRSTITLVAALMLLAFGPASALARHHHHRRHHQRAHHARIERFGRDVSSAPMSSSSAGTVQSFTGGRLTILLGDGSTASGQVTNDTELECTASEQTSTIHADGDTGSGDGDRSGSGDGDNSGSGEDQGQTTGGQSSGDDQGDTAEQNDDQAGDQNDDQAEDQNDDQAEDQNDNQAEDQNEDQDENAGAPEENCSTMSLTPGTVVREAELRITSAGSVWKKVELGS